MSRPPEVMMGMSMPDVDHWSERVSVALGQNPTPFTGPGTNTYLIGTGPERILLDTGQGIPEYLPVLERALEETGCTIQEIVLTHGHPDHIGGVSQIRERFGELEVKKFPLPDEFFEITALEDGSVVRTEGASLRAIHTPGHALDHLCFMLEEESALFSGDNVLGVGTTVIPAQSGDLADYMASLERVLSQEPGRIYPAHGPCIEDGPGKLREYIAHRQDRENQILAALGTGVRRVSDIVAQVYAAYPKTLHPAAGQSVAS
ncbi:MAG: MBL fold metallo-hydrolase, partial [Myxococcota bacterium]